jgi:hypothetical protein
MAKKPAAAKQKRYGMKIEEPVFVTMRDGVQIACRIYRPDAPGNSPRFLPPLPVSSRQTICPIRRSFFGAKLARSNGTFAIRAMLMSIWTFVVQASRAVSTPCSIAQNSGIITSALNRSRARNGVPARSAGWVNPIMPGRSGSWVL